MGSDRIYISPIGAQGQNFGVGLRKLKNAVIISKLHDSVFLRGDNKIRVRQIKVRGEFCADIVIDNTSTDILR